MKLQQIINELEEAARRLGLEVRQEQGRFRGGRCTLDGRDLIVLNKRQPPEMQFAVLAESLRDAGLEGVFLRPAVRKALEEAWGHRDAARTAETADDLSGEADEA